MVGQRPSRRPLLAGLLLAALAACGPGAATSTPPPTAPALPTAIPTTAPTTAAPRAAARGEHRRDARRVLPPGERVLQPEGDRVHRAAPAQWRPLRHPGRGLRPGDRPALPAGGLGGLERRLVAAADDHPLRGQGRG